MARPMLLEKLALLPLIVGGTLALPHHRYLEQVALHQRQRLPAVILRMHQIDADLFAQLEGPINGGLEGVVQAGTSAS